MNVANNVDMSSLKAPWPEQKQTHKTTQKHIHVSIGTRTLLFLKYKLSTLFVK